VESNEAISAAKLGYDVGMFAAMYRLGEGRLPADSHALAVSWGNRYPHVFDVAAASLRAFEEGIES